MQIGSIVSIPLAGAITSGGSLCCAGFSFDIIGESEKAWHVEAELESGKTITAWLPKKALTGVTERGHFGNQPTFTCQLARWFKPSGWTARFIQLATTNSTLTAA
jgi:hypothetical protein